MNHYGQFLGRVVGLHLVGVHHLLVLALEAAAEVVGVEGDDDPAVPRNLGRVKLQLGLARGQETGRDDTAAAAAAAFVVGAVYVVQYALSAWQLLVAGDIVEPSSAP